MHMRFLCLLPLCWHHDLDCRSCLPSLKVECWWFCFSSPKQRVDCWAYSLESIYSIYRCCQRFHSFSSEATLSLKTKYMYHVQPRTNVPSNSHMTKIATIPIWLALNKSSSPGLNSNFVLQMLTQWPTVDHWTLFNISNIRDNTHTQKKKEKKKETFQLLPKPHNMLFGLM